MSHTFTATDYDDGDGFDWSLGGDDEGDFSIGAMDGVLTFNQNDPLMVGPLPSFEDPQDANSDNTYEITVIANRRRHVRFGIRSNRRSHRRGGSRSHRGSSTCVMARQ